MKITLLSFDACTPSNNVLKVPVICSYVREAIEAHKIKNVLKVCIICSYVREAIEAHKIKMEKKMDNPPAPNPFATLMAQSAMNVDIMQMLSKAQHEYSKVST